MIEVEKYKIFIDTRTFSGASNPVQDNFVSIILRKKTDLSGYVDIQKDNSKFSIERQLINPYFIEFSFFDTIKSNGVNYGSDLTPKMINFIQSNFPNTSGYTNFQVSSWFDNEGKNIIIKNEKTNTFPTMSDLNKSDLVWENTVSKANYFPIDVNK